MLETCTRHTSLKHICIQTKNSLSTNMYCTDHNWTHIKTYPTLVKYTQHKCLKHINKQTKQKTVCQLSSEAIQKNWKKKRNKWERKHISPHMFAYKCIYPPLKDQKQISKTKQYPKLDRSTKGWQQQNDFQIITSGFLEGESVRNEDAEWTVVEVVPTSLTLP